MLNIDVGGSIEITKKWKILDIVGGDEKGIHFYHDLNSEVSFPFQDNTVDNYYTSNTLEHVIGYNQSFVFSELYRTLKPGGLIRVVVPDFEKVIQLYLKRRIWKSHTWQPPCRRNTQLGRLLSWATVLGCSKPGSKGYGKERMGHRMAFDWETLRYFLQQAGFVNIILSEHSKGSKIFAEKDRLVYKKLGISLYVEAQK